MGAGDVVVNCAIHPRYRSEAYDAAYDLERAFAERAARMGARVIMLSSRRVYPDESRWRAREGDPATGDETVYGRNKAKTERGILDLLGEHACVLRLSNVFGFEYRCDAPRTTFFGQMLSHLKSHGEIRLDVSFETQRDFIPVEWVAEGVVRAALTRAAGVFNLGGGRPIACGEMGSQVIAGYGAGKILSADVARDEFYLDISKWIGEFGPPGDLEGILGSARRQGESLRYA